VSRLTQPVANVPGGFRLILYEEAPHFKHLRSVKLVIP